MSTGSCAREILLECASHTDPLHDRCGNAELWTEYRESKTLGALISPEHLTGGRKDDRVSGNASTIRAPRPAGNGKQAPGFEPELTVRELIIVGLTSPILDNLTGIPSLILCPAGLSRILLAETFDHLRNPPRVCERLA